MPRKVAFSGKAKKQQLREKRAKHRARYTQNATPSSAPELEAPAVPQPVGHVSVAALEYLSGILTPTQVSSRKAGLNTIFQKETKAEVEVRKKDATRALVYADNRGQSIYTYGIQDATNQPRILTKPQWERNMTSEELSEVDNQAFKNWIHDLDQEEAHRKDGTQINLYERNLAVWQQLWRVIELSSVLVHLADARCPLLHISDRLMAHIRTAFPWKRVVLVLTKTDLVAEERVQEWSTYLQARYGQDIPVLAYSHEFPDRSNAMLMRTVGEVGAGITRYEMAADPTADTRQRGALTMGFVGEPNVGKSTLINGLFGRKLVGVSATPGRTKHLQTHYLDYAEKLECGGDELSRVLVCDCPGVVFPRFNVPVRLQILFGSFPIAQAREPFSAVRFIAENCAPHLYQVYKLQPVGDDSEEWTPYSLCEAYANLRGFHMKGGMLDVHRAANMLLRDALGGKKIVLSFPPPRANTVFSSIELD